MNEVMTAEEVAEYLKCSKNHVQKMARDGKIPARKVGYLWRFSRTVLEQWMRDVSCCGPVEGVQQ